MLGATQDCTAGVTLCLLVKAIDAEQLPIARHQVPQAGATHPRCPRNGFGHRCHRVGLCRIERCRTCGEFAERFALRIQLGLAFEDAQGIAVGTQSLADQQSRQQGGERQHAKAHTQRPADVLHHEGDEIVFRHHHKYRPVALQQVIE